MFEKIKSKTKIQIEKIKYLALAMYHSSSKKVKFKTYKYSLIFHPIRIVKALIGKEVNVEYIEIVLTTMCNLKCKGCSALMTCYKKPYHVDLDKIIKTLDRLNEACDSVIHLRLLGGEPLLYPNMYEVLEYLLNHDKFKRIAIVTNGTMIINDKKVLEILKNDKFYLSISNYGDVSKNYDNLIKQCDENNIKYEPMRLTYEWIDYGDFKKRNRPAKELEYQYNHCSHKRRNIIDGKLFQCFRCAHATNLKYVDLKEEDYIDLLDDSISVKELKNKIYDFCFKYKKCIESCDYCDCYKNSKSIPRGKQ